MDDYHIWGRYKDEIVPAISWTNGKMVLCNFQIVDKVDAVARDHSLENNYAMLFKRPGTPIWIKLSDKEWVEGEFCGMNGVFAHVIYGDATHIDISVDKLVYRMQRFSYGKGIESIDKLALFVSCNAYFVLSNTGGDWIVPMCSSEAQQAVKWCQPLRCFNDMSFAFLSAEKAALFSYIEKRIPYLVVFISKLPETFTLDMLRTCQTKRLFDYGIHCGMNDIEASCFACINFTKEPGNSKKRKHEDLNDVEYKTFSTGFGCAWLSMHQKALRGEGTQFSLNNCLRLRLPTNNTD